MTNDERALIRAGSKLLLTASYHLSVDAMFDSKKALDLITQAMEKFALASTLTEGGEHA